MTDKINHRIIGFFQTRILFDHNDNIANLKDQKAGIRTYSWLTYIFAKCFGYGNKIVELEVERNKIIYLDAISVEKWKNRNPLNDSQKPIKLAEYILAVCKQAKAALSSPTQKQKSVPQLDTEGNASTSTEPSPITLEKDEVSKEEHVQNAQNQDNPSPPPPEQRRLRPSKIQCQFESLSPAKNSPSKKEINAKEKESQITEKQEQVQLTQSELERDTFSPIPEEDELSAKSPGVTPPYHRSLRIEPLAILITPPVDGSAIVQEIPAKVLQHSPGPLAPVSITERPQEVSPKRPQEVSPKSPEASAVADSIIKGEVIDDEAALSLIEKLEKPNKLFSDYFTNWEKAQETEREGLIRLLKLLVYLNIKEPRAQLKLMEIKRGRFSNECYASIKPPYCRALERYKEIKNAHPDGNAFFIARACLAADNKN